MKIWYVLRWAYQALLAELHKLNNMLLADDFYLTAEPTRSWIEVNPETVSLDCNNVQKTPLSIRLWSGEGSIKTELSAYLTLKVESVVGSTVTVLYDYSSPEPVSVYSYTIPSNSYPTANRISVYAYEDAARTKEIGSKQVNIVVENPTPFPRSETWSTDLTYKNGEYLLYEDMIYMYVSRVPGNTSVSPKNDLSSAIPSGRWKAYQNWPLLATNIALIKFGLIGSAVFDGDYQYSQQGIDADGNLTYDYTKLGTSAFSPNMLLDFRLGRFKCNEAELEGILTGGYQNKCVPIDMNSTNELLQIDLSKGSDYMFYVNSGGGRDNYASLPTDPKYIGVSIRISLRAVNAYATLTFRRSMFRWRNSTAEKVRLSLNCMMDVVGVPSVNSKTINNPSGIGDICEWRIINSGDFEKKVDGEGVPSFQSVL